VDDGHGGSACRARRGSKLAGRHRGCGSSSAACKELKKGSLHYLCGPFNSLSVSIEQLRNWPPQLTDNLTRAPYIFTLVRPLKLLPNLTKASPQRRYCHPQAEALRCKASPQRRYCHPQAEALRCKASPQRRYCHPQAEALRSRHRLNGDTAIRKRRLYAAGLIGHP